MSDTIIVAIISGSLTLLGVWLTNRKNSAMIIAQLDKQSELNDQKLDAKLERHQAVTDVKIEELTREVRKHNGFAERVPVLEEQIKVANHRIEDLEHSERRSAS